MLPPITGQLDPKIAPLVNALRDAGWPTTSSCDGEETEAWLHIPFVNIAPRGRGQGSIMGDILQLTGQLRLWRVSANLCAVYSTEAGSGEEGFPLIRLEIFSTLGDAELPQR